MMTANHAETALDRRTDDQRREIVNLGLGYWGSRVLMTAIELGVFATLAAGCADLESLEKTFGLHPRAARDFLDALVALKLLERNGNVYRTAEATNRFLDPAKPGYTGSALEIANARLFGLTAAMTSLVTTGQSRSVAMREDEHRVDASARMPGYLNAMARMSEGPARRLANCFPWEKYRTLLDIGSAQGFVAAAIVEAHPHLVGVGLDRPHMQASFETFVARQGRSQSLRFRAGDALRDGLPTADVVLIGHLLHEFAVSDRKMLIRKAFDCLPSGGALIVFEPMIDEGRRENAFALLLSLNTMIERTAGSCYAAEECQTWMREAGFPTTSAAPLFDPDMMVVGIK